MNTIVMRGMNQTFVIFMMEIKIPIQEYTLQATTEEIQILDSEDGIIMGCLIITVVC